MSLALGARLDPYEIVSALGTGGMKVNRARHEAWTRESQDYSFLVAQCLTYPPKAPVRRVPIGGFVTGSKV
jgi:hypothetical protein